MSITTTKRAKRSHALLRQLESRVAQLLDDLQTAQNDLATYNSQLVSLQTQPERVQNAMYTASQQLQQIRNRLNGTTVGEGAAPDAADAAAGSAGVAQCADRTAA
jgi:predicted  nucleic acid-binding Zn-ribbon protein